MLPKESLVLRSRVRLARNLKLLPFPHRLESERARMLVKAVEEAFYVSKAMEENYSTHRMWELGRTELLVAFEKHLVSAKLINNSDKNSRFSHIKHSWNMGRYSLYAKRYGYDL